MSCLPEVAGPGQSVDRDGELHRSRRVQTINDTYGHEEATDFCAGGRTSGRRFAERTWYHGRVMVFISCRFEAGAASSRGERLQFAGGTVPRGTSLAIRAAWLIFIRNTYGMDDLWKRPIWRCTGKGGWPNDMDLSTKSGTISERRVMFISGKWYVGQLAPCVVGHYRLALPGDVP